MCAAQLILVALVLALLLVLLIVAPTISYNISSPNINYTSPTITSTHNISATS